MVIQRIQSLFLLAVTVLLVVLTFCVPLGEIVQGPARESITLASSGFLHLVIINLLVALLSLVAIFLFKNLKLQIKVTQISVVLVLAALVIYLVQFVFMLPALMISTPGIPVTLYGVALLCAILAYRGECRDRNLLSSYDRLR